MLWLRHLVGYLILGALVCCSPFLTAVASGNESETSIYDVLKLHGLPVGLLPQGVKNFSLDDSGRFHVYLDFACDAKFESELHYDTNVTGIIRYGEIIDVSGISAMDLFLWLPVVEIRVDIPSSGLIYFNVSVVSKQFSLSSFETPRECVASPDLDPQGVWRTIKIFSKILLGKSQCIFSSLKSGKLAIL